MGDKSKIEWTDATWNPIRGCSVVSEGCRNCYAMHVAARFSGEGMPYEGLAYRNGSGAHWTGKVRLIEEHLEDPLRWKKPRRIFVNSMSDLFHEKVTDGQILRIFEIMLRCPQHTFQILTKRPARMRAWFRRWENLEGETLSPQLVRGPKEVRKAHPSGRGQMFAEYLETLGSQPPPGCAWPTFDWMEGMRWWPRSIMKQPNIWLGVSVEDQKTADERIPLLIQTPAAVRFISAEPLLGPIDLQAPWSMLNDEYPAHGIHWVICGGESGPKARPMHPDWARSIRDQCVAAGVPFFFKQWGEYDHGVRGDCDHFSSDGAQGPFIKLNPPRVDVWRCNVCNRLHGESNDQPFDFAKTGKKAAGRLLDGKEWSEYPEAKGVSA